MWILIFQAFPPLFSYTYVEFLANISQIVILIFHLTMNLTFHSFTIFSLWFCGSVVLFKVRTAYNQTLMPLHMGVVMAIYVINVSLRRRKLEQLQCKFMLYIYINIQYSLFTCDIQHNIYYMVYDAHNILSMRMISHHINQFTGIRSFFPQKISIGLFLQMM